MQARRNRISAWLGATCGAFVFALSSGCATTYLAVDDAVELEDGRILFVAFAERDRGPFFGGVVGVEVDFWLDGEKAATGRTDDRGMALVWGRAQPGAKQFAASANLDGRSHRESGRIVQWRSDQVVVACDIDATISETDLQALFFEEIDEKSKPIGNSAEVLGRIAEHHGIVYFTARPKFTLDKTQQWLEAHGYPSAPVLTSLATGDLITQARYKRRELGKLRSRFPNVMIGIGNSHVDSEGYGANGMLALIVNREKDARYGRHEIEFETWEQVDHFFEANRELLTDPQRLEAAVRGDEMVVVPTLRFSEPTPGE